MTTTENQDPSWLAECAVRGVTRLLENINPATAPDTLRSALAALDRQLERWQVQVIVTLTSPEVPEIDPRIHEIADNLGILQRRP